MENSTFTPGDCSFLTLPKNLREQIVGYLPIDDVKNFRRVSKQCKQDASFTISERLKLNSEKLRKDETWTSRLDAYFESKKMSTCIITDCSHLALIVLFSIVCAVLIFGFVRQGFLIRNT